MIMVIARLLPEMSEEDGKQLVRDAIRAGSGDDIGSGSNVDLVVVKPKDDVSDSNDYKLRFDRLNIQVQYLRGFDEANVNCVRRQKYTFKKVCKEVVIIVL